MFKLTLYFTPPGGNSNTKAIDFHYHPRHIKGNKLKASGIRNVNASTAVVVRMPDENLRLFTGQPNGIAYVENIGVIDAANAVGPSRVATREMLLAGAGAAWKMDEMLIHSQGDGAIVNLTFTTSKTGAEPHTTLQPKELETLHRGFSRFHPGVSGEGIIVHYEAPIQKDLQLNYAIYKSQDIADEHSMAPH